MKSFNSDQVQGRVSRKPGRARRSAAWLGLSVLLAAGSAWAGAYTHVATHVTSKSPEHVLGVLTAYGQVCDKGCKYYGPDVKEFVQLSQKKTDTSWYTWTWVTNAVRDVKYFNKVTKTVKTDGTLLLITRQLDESDQALIDELSKATGKPHAPAFDKGKTIFVIRTQEDGKTKVVQDMSMTASGMIDMFGDKIKDGMKAGAAATFKNIEK